MQSPMAPSILPRLVHPSRGAWARCWDPQVEMGHSSRPRGPQDLVEEKNVETSPGFRVQVTTSALIPPCEGWPKGRWPSAQHQQVPHEGGGEGLSALQPRAPGCEAMGADAGGWAGQEGGHTSSKCSDTAVWVSGFIMLTRAAKSREADGVCLAPAGMRW